MKTIAYFISVCLLTGFLKTATAQSYIRLDASFYSETLDEVKNIDVFLPADYYVHPEQQYATIYYLHGMNANQNEGTTDALIYYNTHGEDTTITSPPAIFVCSDNSCEPYEGSYYMNSVLYGPYEDYFMQDVIEFVESNFRAIPDKNFRFLTGWSMGGTGAARFALKYPDQFRAVVSCEGMMAVLDTLLNAWRSFCYQENGSYNITYNGYYSKKFITSCGALSPNLNIEPYYVEIPFDTMGNWVDTVLDKWRREDLSAMVRNLPDENQLSWFLVCGKQDVMCTYPTYLTFMDSLDAYEIGYDSDYFEGGHVWHPESWLLAIPWLDSIIDLSYRSLGVETTLADFSAMEVFPVPAQDFINISFLLDNPETVEIGIMDLQGRIVKSIGRVSAGSGYQTVQMDIQTLPSGIYLCRLQVGEQTMVKRLIKL